MPVAYISKPGAAIKVEGRSLIVTHESERLASIELEHLGLLALFGRVQITTPALLLLLTDRIPVALFSRGGRLRGRLVPPTGGAIEARIAQHRLLASPGDRLAAARAIVDRKLHAMLAVIDRANANHPERRDPALRDRLLTAIARSAAADSLASLLGVEGAAAAAYFAALSGMNRSPLPFNGRTTRPPRDPINAMLSFGYTLLVNETWSFLDALGLDPYIGIYHEVRPSRPALALDLVEPFRHAIVDRAVLRAANTGMLAAGHFTASPDGGVRFTRVGMKRFFRVYEAAMLASPERALARPGETLPATARDLLRRRCESALAWFRSFSTPGSGQNTRRAA